MGDRVEPRREQRGAGQRLPGVEAVVGVPPDPAGAPRRRVPAGDADEVLRELRIEQVAAVAGGAIGVQEGEPPPAVVVEPGGLALLALARSRPEPRDGLEVRVQVALGAPGEAVELVTMARRGRGNLAVRSGPRRGAPPPRATRRSSRRGWRRTSAGRGSTTSVRLRDAALSRAQVGRLAAAPCRHGRRGRSRARGPPAPAGRPVARADFVGRTAPTDRTRLGAASTRRGRRPACRSVRQGQPLAHAGELEQALDLRRVRLP